MTKQICLIILSLVLLFPAKSYSQTDEDKNNFYDGVFFLTEEDYQEALSAFNKVYKDNYIENANLNYLMGLCYLKITGEKQKAIPYLQKAIKNLTYTYSESNFKETAAPYDALMLIADAYRIDEQLDSADHYYNKYLENLEDYKEYERALTLQEIEATKRARVAIEGDYYLVKENIGNLYNSSFDNYNPVASSDGSAIAYMSEQRFYNAVIFVEVNNGRWSNPINITPQIQSDGDQYVTSLSPDGKTMYLIRSNMEDADIMVSHYESKRWTKSQSIGKPVNTKYFESHASISPDGKTLYFLSNRKGSIGGMDIFKTELNKDGDWSEPVNLGKNINTPLNEDSPVLCNNGTTLYFSSQGHKSIGGYDIFKSELQPDGNWSEPEPLPYPLNSTDDDLNFYPLSNDNSGYMARIEAEGLGGEDIYLVNLTNEPPVSEKPVETVAEQTTEKEDPLSKVEQVDNIAENLGKEKETKPDQKPIVQPILKPDETLPSAKYYIKPIFFGFDSYSLNDVSKSKLEDIKKLMKAFPELNLKVMGHTDSKGPDVYNQYLSEQRCKGVFNYLIESGVDKTRLELIGYGENNPAAKNETDDGKDSVKGRQLNRRVEFKISVNKEDMIVIEPVNVPPNLKIK